MKKSFLLLVFLLLFNVSFVLGVVNNPVVDQVNVSKSSVSNNDLQRIILSNSLVIRNDLKSYIDEKLNAYSEQFEKDVEDNVFELEGKADSLLRKYSFKFSLVIICSFVIGGLLFGWINLKINKRVMIPYNFSEGVNGDKRLVVVDDKIIVEDDKNRSDVKGGVL